MDLANRLRKRQRHLRKWARRNGITCYRLYERDIPEYPLIVDWYDGEAVVWLYRRRRDETAAESDAWRSDSLAQIRAGLGVSDEQIFVKERARQQGNSQYTRLSRRSHVRTVEEQGLRFEVNLSDYLDTGLFLDHRPTRAEIRARAQNRRFLNLYAYSGSFSCYAAAGGARSTTTVDISKTYCEWASRNLLLNGFEPGPTHRVLQKDSHLFLEEEIRSKQRYDLIVCDPPTFSNSKRMSRPSFSVERDHVELIAACGRILAVGGELYFSTNARNFSLAGDRLPPDLAVTDITEATVPEDFRRRTIHRCWRVEKR